MSQSTGVSDSPELLNVMGPEYLEQTSQWLYSSTWTAIKTYHRLRGWNNTHSFPHSSGGGDGEFKIKVLAWLFLVRTLFLACRWLPSCRVLMWPFLWDWVEGERVGGRERKRERTLISLLKRTLIVLDQGPLMTHLFFSLIFSLYWSIADLQCCVSFRCTAKWFSYSFHLNYFLSSPISKYSHTCG